MRTRHRVVENMDRNPSSISPSSSSSTKVDRKTLEKNRRDEMKTLFTNLNSLLPHQHHAASTTPRERMVLSDQIDAAAKYIKELQASIERLQETKRNLSRTDRNEKKRSNTASASGTSSLKPPEIEVSLKGNSAMEVVVITPDVGSQTIFSEAIRVLHDEGVEIVNASFSVVDDTSVLHTIHGKIEETASKEGAIGRITERLKRFLFNS